MLKKFVSRIEIDRLLPNGTCRAVVCYNEQDSDNPARYADITVFVTPSPNKTMEQIRSEALENAESYMRSCIQSGS